jgi:hypothetical protein
MHLADVGSHADDLGDLAVHPYREVQCPAGVREDRQAVVVVRQDVPAQLLGESPDADAEFSRRSRVPDPVGRFPKDGDDGDRPTQRRQVHGTPSRPEV